VQSFRRIVAYALFLSLTACGGGGGGGGSTIPQATPTPATNLGQQAVQRSDAQSALSGVQAYEESAGGGSISTLTAVRAIRRALAKANPRHPLTCSGGENTTVVNNGNGTATETITDYYNVSCTGQPEDQIVWTASEPNSTTLTGPATFTQWSQTGQVTGTANATITFYIANGGETITGFSFLLTNVVQNGTTLGDVGLACSVNTSGASTACGIAAVANVPSINAMDGASVSLAVGTSSVSMQISAYQGAENALSIAQGAFPAWTISPSSDQTASVSIAGQATNTGFTLTLTDSTNGGTFAITGSSNGTVTGTLTNNSTSATVATFTVDSAGNGTLTYSNGTQVQIVDYVVQG
jgi:hypothetical protein